MLIWENNEDIRLIDCGANAREIQRQLNDCRNERRPYVFVRPSMLPIDTIACIIVPVSMLEEEVYKAEICTYLARKTGAKLILLKANDYGHKAQQNINRIISHIKTVSERTGEQIKYEVQLGKKDSFSINREAAERQRDFDGQLVLITASREYGLDDWIFGPQERRIIQRSSIPVMLINPREDLFTLCD